MKITKPATLAALFAGSLENAIIAETPGGIEAQEARGQRDFVTSETLPIKCNNCKREQLEQLGIVFGEPVDDLFVGVQLPKGWKKERTDHSMWSKLIDNKGRKRAEIFYKAAFYDKRADIRLCNRYTAATRPVLGYEKVKESEWYAVVLDSDDNIVWHSKERIGIEPSEHQYPEGDSAPTYWDGGKKSTWSIWYDEKHDLNKIAVRWLDENYPEWQDPTAYWD